MAIRYQGLAKTTKWLLLAIGIKSAYKVNKKHVTFCIFSS